MKAKKSYGQHFLNQPAIAEQIAKSLTLTDSYENVLEVGPGTGNLTRFLLEEPFNLKVVEADRDMVFALASKYPKIMDGIIREDFLKVNLNEVFEGKSFGLIGNFPYNISSQILFKMLEYKELIPEMVGMFQKEVADRVVAKSGSKTYGVISVLIQAFYEETGCPVLLNTSFNVRGEPIVCSPSDAYQCFKNTEMDILVIHQFIYERKK